MISVISWIFPSEFQNIYITSVSSHSMQFKLKICETVTGISTINQFHNFWRVFVIWTYCALKGCALLHAAYCLVFIAHWLIKFKTFFFVKTFLASWIFKNDQIWMGKMNNLPSCKFIRQKRTFWNTVVLILVGINAYLAPFLPYVGQPSDNHIGHICALCII